MAPQNKRKAWTDQISEVKGANRQIVIDGQQSSGSSSEHVFRAKDLSAVASSSRVPNTGRFRVTVVPTSTAVPSPNNEERRSASTLRPAPQVEVAPTPTIGTQPGMRLGNSRLNQDASATIVCGGYSVPNITRGTQDIAVEPTASLALNVLTAERTSVRTLSDVPADTDVTVTFLHASLEENGQGISGRTDGCHFDFSCPWCHNIFSVRTYANKVFYVVDAESGDIQESYGVQEGLHVFCGSCKNTKPGINQGMLIEVSAPSADAQGLS